MYRLSCEEALFEVYSSKITANEKWFLLGPGGGGTRAFYVANKVEFITRKTSIVGAIWLYFEDTIFTDFCLKKFLIQNLLLNF